LKSFALVPHSTSGVETRLGSVDEEVYEGILFTDQDSKFALQDRYICSIPNRDNRRSFGATEFLEWHIGLLMRRMEKMEMVREA
jgi:hypothetical protein